MGLTGSDEVVVTVLSTGAVSKRLKVNIYGGVNPYIDLQWNNWDLSTGSGSAKFQFSDGTASNINATITSAGVIADNGTGYATSSTVCPPAVLRYNSANTSVRTLNFYGLNSNKLYTLEFYASRNNTGNSSIYQVGNLSDTISTSNNVNDYAKFINVRPDLTGRVNVNISRIGTWNYLAGFQVIEQETTVSSRTVVSNVIVEQQLKEDAVMKSKKGIESFLIYPNPAHDYISIEIPVSVRGINNIRITNAASTVFQNIKPVNSKSSGTCRLDISSLQKGIYIVEIFSEGKTFRSKIFKL